IQDDIIGFEGLTFDQIIKLAEGGVKSKDDLADLAGDELVEILGKDAMNEGQANRMIMAARADWFKDDENTEEGADAAQAANG
ncbi:MAG TPA: transcription termination/antitermination protein NusA, partial [Alphaproteobacteria bacterium]